MIKVDSGGVMRWTDSRVTRVAIPWGRPDGWEIMEVGEMVSATVATEADARHWCETGEIIGEIAPRPDLPTDF